MNLTGLHQELFGRNPKDTPVPLRVSDLHRQLYARFPAVRGVSREGKDFEALPAIIVMSAAQIHQGMPSKVFIFTTKSLEGWVLKGLRLAARRILRCKKGDMERQNFVRDMFNHIIVSHQFAVMPEPPEWVAIGISRSTPGVPLWLKKKLCVVG